MTDKTDKRTLMGKIFTQQIDRFSESMTDEKSSKDFSKCSTLKHFDAFSYRHKLVPRVKSVAIEGEDKDKKIAKMMYIPYSSTLTTYRIVGFGASATDKATMYFYDGDNDVWAFVTGEVTGGARSKSVFFYYKGFIYVFHSGSLLSREDVTDSTGLSSTYQSIRHTNFE